MIGRSRRLNCCPRGSRPSIRRLAVGDAHESCLVGGAKSDSDGVVSDIGRSSPHYSAVVVSRKILAAVPGFFDFTESGQIVPELGGDAVREAIRSPYRIIYEMRLRAVEMVIGFRASRLLVPLHC